MSIAHQNAHTIIRDILSKQHIERVWFVGCGGSLTGFWPGKYFLDCEAKKLAVGYVTSNEFVHATPNALGKNSVVILASQQGNTAETVEAARIARQKGAATIGLVYTPGTPLCEHSDYTIEYCWARYPETVDPTQQKAAYSLWLALEVLAQTEGYAHYDEMVSAFASFESVVRGAQQQVQADARHFAEAWKTEKVIYMMGSGPSFGAAHQESICILLEMQWINSASIHSGEYFHGPFEVTEDGVFYFLQKGSGKCRPMDERAEDFLKTHTDTLMVLDALEYGMDAIDPAVRDYLDPVLFYPMNCELRSARGKLFDHDVDYRRYMGKVDY